MNPEYDDILSLDKKYTHLNIRFFLEQEIALDSGTILTVRDGIMEPIMMSIFFTNNMRGSFEYLPCRDQSAASVSQLYVTDDIPDNRTRKREGKKDRTHLKIGRRST